MPRSRSAALPMALLLAGAAADLGGGQEQGWTARDLALRVQLTAEPRQPFRYNQEQDPYGNSTRTMLGRRRAFFPGETVRFSFRVPQATNASAPLEVRAALLLSDLDGTTVQEAGEAALRADGSGTAGTIDWTVPAVAEGSYLLAARFKSAAGDVVGTRSDVVFIAPEYPSLLAAARAAPVDPRGLAPLLRDVSLPSVEMLVEDAQMRFDDFGRAPRDWAFVKRQMETAREYRQGLAAGKDPYEHRAGLLVKAYRSELDGTLQPYALYVPRAYDPRRPWPLLVTLHGAGSSHILNRRRVFGLGNRPGESDYEAVRNEDVAFPETDMIVLAPYGRGEIAGYSGIGEGDVLRAMADVQRAYNVDEDRVYLTGLSMGGGGTWHLGLRYPDRFAAIVPVCAVGDLSASPGGPERSPEDLAFIDLTGPTAIAENASNLQVFAFHGDEDGTVSVEHSRRLVARYRELGWLGRSVRYFELPGVGHPAWDFAYREASLFPRLAGIRRNRYPDHVVYSTFSPRFNQAYWLRIDRIDRGLALARIEATRRGSRFEVSTRNLSAFTLLLEPGLVPEGTPVEVIVDGTPAWRGPARGRALSLARKAGARWTQAPWTGPAVGPPDHAEASFRSVPLAQSGPHVYVYGTGGDAEARAATRAEAEKLADWGPNVRARWRVIADTEVTPEILAGHHLVLVGNASLNRMVARLADRLPLRQDARGTFAGTRQVAGPDASWRLHCANPLAAGRYVLVYGAGSAEGLKRATAPRPVPRPDYAVIGADGRTALSGYFKDDWTIPAR